MTYKLWVAGRGLWEFSGSYAACLNRAHKFFDGDKWLIARMTPLGPVTVTQSA